MKPMPSPRIRAAFSLLILATTAAACLPAFAAGPSCSDTGTVLRFDGLDDCFTVPFDATFPTAVFTLAAWVRLDDGDGGIVVRGEDNASDNLAWALLYNGEGLAVQLEDAQDVDFVYQSQVVVNDGLWHHAAATRTSGGTLDMYVDSVPVAQFQSTLVPSSNNSQTITIGCYIGGEGHSNPQPPGGYATGVIEDVTVWNRALSAQEIEDLYHRPPSSNDPDLDGFWRFDEGIGQTSQDGSPEGNHGTLGFGSSTAADDPTWDTYALAVVDLRVQPVELSWYPPPRADDTYDVVQGDLLALTLSHGDFATSTDSCLANNQEATTLAEPTTPSPGQSFWYAVRRVTPSGNSTYDSCAASQVGSRDAEIGASGFDCVP
jgi:hypothetical protein